MKNIYQPDLMEVIDVEQQTADVQSVRLRFRDDARAKDFSFRVGQFGLFSVFGEGESTFNICSSSNWTDFLEFCFRRTGKVTDALWSIDKNDTIGFRGPYGNGYPVEKWRGRNLIFIGGGIAMPPIRCAIWYALENRDQFGDISIVYGAAHGRGHGLSQRAGPLGRLRSRSRGEVRGPRRANRRLGRPGGLRAGRVGSGRDPGQKRGGPGRRPAGDDQVHSAGSRPDGHGRRRRLHEPGKSDEVRRGQVRRCNCGPVYVCKEGPVFTLDQLRRLPSDY